MSFELRTGKLWRNFRRARPQKPNRLVVTKMRWLGGALSPVVLMIDDLTNAWHSHAGGQAWERGGDWGGGLDDPRGAVAFLEKRLLADFPEARTTFFVVAGAISAYTQHQPFSHSAPLDENEQSIRFFRKLHGDPRFELAYHGYDHGTPSGATAASFLQEWRGFGSVEAAVSQTRKGLDIFQRSVGAAPRGGKYGGWDYNEHAESALNACGFSWWCRDWMPRDTTQAIDEGYYEPHFFGSNLVVALPSTVHGYFWDRRQIELLLASQQVISIEEHIAPVRPDGLVQTPNIVDDIDELRRLYRYLRKKPVWHANCTDIARYVIAREQTFVLDVTRDTFCLRYSGREEHPVLTVRVDCSAICDPRSPRIAITAPNGLSLDSTAYKFDDHSYRHLVTLPVMDGTYTARPCA